MFENPWLWRWVHHSGCQSPTAVICRAGLKLLSNIFEVEAHNLKCTKHVLDEQHPSSVANTNEPLVGVIWKRTPTSGSFVFSTDDGGCSSETCFVNLKLGASTSKLFHVCY